MDKCIKLKYVKESGWDLNYSCNVKTRQKLYNEDLSYKFVYRPIDLSNAFPNNREPLNNWANLYNDKENYEKLIIQGRNKNINKPEYQIKLTPKTISSIKEYNDNNKYISFSNMTIEGKSKYLSDLIGDERQTTFNNLGECNNNCWISESKIEYKN